MSSHELTTQVSKGAPSLTEKINSDDVVEAFESALEGQRRIELDLLPCWTIDHRKKKFRCGDVYVDELVGYPVFWCNARQWWASAYDPRTAEGPACWSTNGFTPSPSAPQKQATTCASCKWSQWGSSRLGKGQECRLSTIVFLANPQFGTPPISWFSAPPTSYKTLVGNFRRPGYFATAKWVKTPSGTPIRVYELVWTQFTLEEGGPVHCVVKAKALATCTSKEDAAALAKLRKMVSQIWNEQAESNVAQESIESDNGNGNGRHDDLDQSPFDELS